MAVAFLWKLALAVALICAIVVSVSARAPRKPLAGADLRRLVISAIALYGVALMALLKHHSELAVLLFAAGIAVSTLAAWLSRGSESEGGSPGRDDPIGERPPPDPPSFDWVLFERELREYVERPRELAESR